MDLVSLATDKYCGYRLEGLSCERSFSSTCFEVHRYLMDFVYHSGEPMSDRLYEQMGYILENIAFTQNAEFTYQLSRQKIKSPA